MHDKKKIAQNLVLSSKFKRKEQRIFSTKILILFRTVKTLVKNLVSLVSTLNHKLVYRTKHCFGHSYKNQIIARFLLNIRVLFTIE